MELYEKCAFVVHDDVEVELLADDFHASQEVGGDGAYDDAVVVVVEWLYLGEVGFDGLIGLSIEVGKEDGALNTCTAFLLEVFGYEAAHFVVLYVVHYKENHILWGAVWNVD